MISCCSCGPSLEYLLAVGRTYGTSSRVHCPTERLVCAHAVRRFTTVSSPTLCYSGCLARLTLPISHVLTSMSSVACTPHIGNLHSSCYFARMYLMQVSCSPQRDLLIEGRFEPKETRYCHLYSSSCTYSAIARLLVNPGLSMPSRFTNPSTPSSFLM